MRLILNIIIIIIKRFIKQEIRVAYRVGESGNQPNRCIRFECRLLTDWTAELRISTRGGMLLTASI